MGSKDTKKVARGDTIITKTSGGGGWGPPYERDPEAVRWDVIEQLVSVERARDEYGVVVDGPDHEVDPEATMRCRDQMKTECSR